MTDEECRHLWDRVAAHAFPLDTQALTHVCLTARLDAHRAAIRSSGVAMPADPDTESVHLHQTEAENDSTSIDHTMRRMAEAACLAYFLSLSEAPTETGALVFLRQWIQTYSVAKSQQVASYETGRGWDTGILAVIGWLLQGSGQGADTSADMVVTVIPSGASCDTCETYAGEVFEIDEADTIPEFPIHPNCPHMKLVIPRNEV